MATTATRLRSTADAQRARVIRAAVPVFARQGYHGTPVTAVADAAGISQAYVFRLFTSKLGLFVAALEECYARVEQSLVEGAEQARGESPTRVLEAMGDAYADLIADRDLLMLQVHAQSASDVHEVRDAVQHGYEQLVTTARTLSGGSDAQVQQFVALGQLCHLIVTADLVGVDAPYARILTAGMRHVEPGGGRA